MYAQVVKRFPGVKIGSYPVNGTAETVVTFEWLQGVSLVVSLCPFLFPNLCLSVSVSLTTSVRVCYHVSMKISLFDFFLAQVQKEALLKKSPRLRW